MALLVIRVGIDCENEFSIFNKAAEKQPYL
jgi:hypothetical protein